MIISRNEYSDMNNKNIVKIGTETIERVHVIKYLGILMDDKLNFDEQARQCTAKASSKVNFLYRISKKLPTETKKIVYNSIIKPQFDYCSTVY